MNIFRFMPDEIYIDALRLGVRQLASDMNDIMNNSRRYLNFFKWRDYYTFHASNEDHYYDVACKLCTFLNNKPRSEVKKVYEDIANWWNLPNLGNRLPESSGDDFTEKSTQEPLDRLDKGTIAPDTEDNHDIVTNFLQTVIGAVFE